MASKQFAFVVFFAVVIAINAKPTNSDEGIFLTQVCYNRLRAIVSKVEVSTVAYLIYRMSHLDLIFLARTNLFGSRFNSYDP